MARLETIIESLKANQNRNSTLGVYLSVWRQFNRFLLNLDRKPKAWEDRAMLFMAHLIHDKKFQSSTIKSYMSAIKRMLVDDMYDWQDNKILLTTLTRACRVVNDRVRTHLPIHCSLLEMILFEIGRMFSTPENNQPYLKCLFESIFLLGYYGLMRVSQLVKSPHVVKARNLHLAASISL